MRRLFVLLALVVMAGVFMTRRQEPVRLAVVVVVDQLRADLLDRYDGVFTGGLRRLRDQGFRFTNATHDHWWTETAAGHTALATGAYPTHNGIVMNTFATPDADRIRSVYSFADPESPILGVERLPGRSPVNMRRPPFAEWLVEHEPRARVTAMSRKDRGAIPLAGRTPATVLWVDIEGGRFVTSEYYATEYPAWVDDFNEDVMAPLYADSVWNLEVPAGAAALARRDSAIYENGGRDVTFPHAASERPGNQSYNAWVAETPVPDRATFLLARRAMEELRLGREDHVDFLSISLSQTDAIGHNWGPLSLEQLDNLLRLDRGLGEFMDWLDEFVGRNRWVLAFSADHGVMTAPEYLEEQGEEAWRLTSAEARMARGIAAELTDPAGTVTRDDVIARIEMLPHVADVVTLRELTAAASPTDSITQWLRNSFVPDRGSSWIFRWGFVVRNAENVITGSSDAGNHGSPYHYDRHVPLVFMGGGIRSGVSGERAATVDLAPTLAKLLGVPVPEGLDGVSRAAALAR